MAAEASVALMHRITNVRLPGPLPGDGDQRYAIDLDEQGLICRIKAMGGVAQQVAQTEAQQTDADWNGDWLSPRGVDLQINGGLGLARCSRGWAPRRASARKGPSRWAPSSRQRPG